MRGAWGEKEKIMKIILFLSFEPTWGAPLGVVLPLGWRGSLGGDFFQVLVLIFNVVGGVVTVAGVTLGFFQEPGRNGRSYVICLFISKNQWLDPIGPYPSAGIMRRASSQPSVDWSTIFSKRRKYHVNLFKCCYNSNNT